MEKIERSFEDRHYTHPSGRVTVYQVETIKKDGANPIFIVRDSPQNNGPKHYDRWEYRDAVAEQVSTRAREQYGLEPRQIQVFQERNPSWDKDYDQVSFRYLGWEPNQKQAQWGEYKREAYDKDALTRFVDKYRQQEALQKVDGNRSQERITASLPEFDRKSISKEELKELEQKAEQTAQQRRDLEIKHSR